MTDSGQTAPDPPGTALAPLSGIRVLDLTTVMMGPAATQIMAGLGAEILKIEVIDGEPMRSVGRPDNRSIGPLFHTINHSKKSIALNLKAPAGREALFRLAATADVVIFNMRPKAMERLQLGYEAFRQRNAAIIYMALTGYGERGRYAGKPAYDDLIQAAVALPSLLQLNSGADPRYVPLALADRIVGIQAVNQVLAAIINRARTGLGDAIELPMFETMAQFVLTDHLGGSVYSPPAGGQGYARLLSPDRRPYATLDGHVAILPYSDGHWRRFLAAAGQEELFDNDPRLRDMGTRTTYIDQLYQLLAGLIVTKTTREWLAICEAIDVPAMPVHDLASLRADPHLADVGLFRWIDHPADGPVCVMAQPSSWKNAVLPEPNPAPTLGQHTAAALAAVGYTAGELDKLASEGAVYLGKAVVGRYFVMPRHLVDPELLGMLEVFPTVDFDAEVLPVRRQALELPIPGAPLPVIEPQLLAVPGAGSAPDVPILLFDPPGRVSPAAILHIHGGGMIMGSASMNDVANAALAVELGVPIVSVDYRLAPECRFPGPQEDCLAAWDWLVDQAERRGIDPGRIAVMGESAGGLLAAALCQMVRDLGRGVPCAQVLVYPMLDHRTGGERPGLAHTGQFIWTGTSNQFGWNALRGNYGCDDERAGWFSPALANDLANLPPTFIAVGALDLFAQEDMAYAARLIAAGVPTELHLYPGAFHGFDMVPTAAVALNYKRDFLAALRRLLRV